MQSLDGQRHQARKALLLDLTSRPNVDRLVTLTRQQWHAAIADWERAGQVVLFDETMRLLCRAVCEWAGVPLAVRGPAAHGRDGCDDRRTRCGGPALLAWAMGTATR